MAERKILRWTPTTRVGMQHGIKKMQNNANMFLQTSRLLKNPRVQEMLSKGIVPSELKSPTYRQFFKESLKTNTGLKAGLAVGYGMGIGAGAHEVLSSSDAAMVGLIIGGITAASAYGVPGTLHAAGGRIMHRVSPQGRAQVRAKTFKRLTPEQIQKASEFFANQAVKTNASANELRTRLAGKLQRK